MDRIPWLVSRITDSQMPSGAVCGSYGVHTNGEDWQSTACGIMALACVDQALYQGRINSACYWLRGTQDAASGGWVYSDGTHYPEVGGENTRGLYFGQASVEETWSRYSSSPVLTGSSVQDGCVIKDGSTYKMWYWLRDDQTIWYADSADGISWANKQQVLTKSGGETMIVEGPAVIKDGPTSYKMWYSGRDSSGKETIRYATSTDGLAWSKVLDGANPKKVLNVGGTGAWDSFKLRDPWVIDDAGTLKMWYAGCSVWPMFKIGYATSTDGGTTWTKHASNPVYSGTVGGWDGFQVYGPSVVKDGSTYHMYYSGTDANMSQVWSTGYATSGDGITWAAGARNPVLVPDVLDSLDFPSVMNDGGTWKMWYSQPYPPSGAYGIFYATLGTSTELYLSPAVASIPNNNATTKTFTVTLANAVNLYGYQYVVTFDATKLEATAAVTDTSFFDGSVVNGWNATIDNGAGKVRFAMTRMSPDAAVNGSGTLATVTFRSKTGSPTGTCRITFSQTPPEEVKLGDVEGNSLPVFITHAWLTLYGTGNLQGTVDLQGRADESGAQVQALNASGYVATTSINAAGAWSFTGIPAGEYQVNIEMERYLDARKGDFATWDLVQVNAGATTTLSKVKLLGGDCNGTIDDDVINILDIVTIGGVFGTVATPTTRPDINADLTVNILDLVLAAGNYTLSSPVPWP